MNGQGDGHVVTHIIIIFFGHPVLEVVGPVAMNFPQGHDIAAIEGPGELDPNIDVDNNMNNPNMEDVHPDAGTDMEINQQAEEEDPLLGVSRQRSREEDDDEDEERSCKRFRWWDEFADSDSDSCYDSFSLIGMDSDADASDEEEDPLPGATTKRKRDDKDKDERNSKKSRQ